MSVRLARLCLWLHEIKFCTETAAAWHPSEICHGAGARVTDERQHKPSRSDDRPLPSTRRCARPAQRGRQITGQPLASLRRYLDGAAAGWPHSILGAQIARGSAKRRPGCWSRTMSERLCTHLVKKYVQRPQKRSTINSLFFDWCGQEDSNLHALRR